MVSPVIHGSFVHDKLSLMTESHPLLQNLVCEILFSSRRQGQQAMDLAFLLKLRCCSRQANRFANDLIRELALAPAVQVVAPHPWPKGMSIDKAERLLILCLSDLRARDLGLQETERLLASFVSRSTVGWHKVLLKSVTKKNRCVLLKILLTSSALCAQSALLKDLQAGHEAQRSLRYSLLTDSVMDSSDEILKTHLGILNQSGSSLESFLPSQALAALPLHPYLEGGKQISHLQALFKIAVEKNKPKQVRTLLLETSLEVEPAFFNHVVSLGNVAIVKAILDSGVDLVDRTCECSFVHRFRHERSLNRTAYLETPLLAAISSFTEFNVWSAGFEYYPPARSGGSTDYGVLRTHAWPAVTKVEKLAMVRLVSMVTADVSRRTTDKKMKPLPSSALRSSAFHVAALMRVEGGEAAAVFQELMASPSFKPNLLDHASMITEVMKLACERGNADVVVLMLDLDASLQRAQPSADTEGCGSRPAYASLRSTLCFSYEKLHKSDSKCLETLIKATARRPALLSQLVSLKLRLTADRKEPDYETFNPGNSKSSLETIKVVVTQASSGASLLEAACKVKAPPACLRLLIQNGAEPQAELDNEVKRMLKSTTAAGSKHTQQILEFLTNEGTGKDKEQLGAYFRSKLLAACVWNGDQCPGRASAVAFLLRHLDVTEAVLRESVSGLLSSYERRKSTKGDHGFAPTLCLLFLRLKKDFAVDDAELFRLLSEENHVLSFVHAGKSRQPPLLQAMLDLESFHRLDPPMEILRLYLEDAKAKLDQDEFRTFLNNRNSEGCSALDFLFSKGSSFVPDCFLGPLLECAEIGEGFGSLLLRHLRRHGGKNMEMKIAKKNVKLENSSVFFQDGEHKIHVEFLGKGTQQKTNIAVVDLGRRRGPRGRVPSSEPEPEQQAQGESESTSREGDEQHFDSPGAEQNPDEEGGELLNEQQQALTDVGEGGAPSLEPSKDTSDAKGAPRHDGSCCFGCGFEGEYEAVATHEEQCPVKLSGSSEARYVAAEGKVMWAPAFKWPNKAQWAVQPHLVLSGCFVDEGWVSSRQEVGLVFDCAECGSFSCAQGHKAFRTARTPSEILFWSRQEDTEGGMCCFRLLLLKLLRNTSLLSSGSLQPSEVASLQRGLIERRWWDVLFALLAQTRTEAPEDPLQTLTGADLHDICLHGTATMVEQIIVTRSSESHPGDAATLFLLQRETIPGEHACSPPLPRTHDRAYQAPVGQQKKALEFSSALQDAFRYRRWSVVSTILEHVQCNSSAVAALCKMPSKAVESPSEAGSESQAEEPRLSVPVSDLVPPVEAILQLCFERDDTPDRTVDLVRKLGIEGYWSAKELLDRAVRLLWVAMEDCNWRRAERIIETGLMSPNAPQAELKTHVRALVNSRDPASQQSLLLRVVVSRNRGKLEHSLSPEQERFLEKLAQKGSTDCTTSLYSPTALRYCILGGGTTALRVLLNHPECVRQTVVRTDNMCPLCVEKLQLTPCLKYRHQYMPTKSVSSLDLFWLKFFEGNTEPRAELYDLLSLFLVQNRCPPTEKMLAQAQTDFKLLGIMTQSCAQLNDSTLNGKLATFLRTMLHASAGQVTEGMRTLMMVDHPSSQSPEPLFLADSCSSLEDETILSLAVRLGNAEAAAALLKHKCVSDRIDQKDSSGCTPLHRACQSLATGKDAEACINLLLDAGADASVCDDAGRVPGSFLRFSGGFSGARQRLRGCLDGPEDELSESEAQVGAALASSSESSKRNREPFDNAKGASVSGGSFSTARGNPVHIPETALRAAEQLFGEKPENQPAVKRARPAPVMQGETEEETAVRAVISADNTIEVPDDASEGQGVRKGTRKRKRKMPGM